MGGFTFRIRVYKLEYNMTEVCFPFVSQSIQLQKLFVSMISCSERGSGLLNRREDQDWSKMWGLATLCGASQFLLELVPLCRMDGRRWRKGCTKLLAGPWSHGHKPNLFEGWSDCLFYFWLRKMYTFTSFQLHPPQPLHRTFSTSRPDLSISCPSKTSR